MKIMLINTQGMYIYFHSIFFFSQLPKIKIAFNSYIYKHSDSLRCGFGRSEVQSLVQQSGRQRSFFSVCPPHVPSGVFLQGDHAQRWRQKESMVVRWGSRGWTFFVFQPASGGLNEPVLFHVTLSGRQPEVHSNVHTSRSWTMKSSFLERISLLKVLQELLRPWYKSASSHKPNRPPPPPSSKELMSPLMKYEFSPLHLKTLKWGLNV